MKIFKRKIQIDTENIFHKILLHRNIDSKMMNKSEINFLQTPSNENISAFCQLLSEIEPCKMFTFFHNLKNITKDAKDIEQQSKIKLFSERLLIEYVQNVTEKNEDNCNIPNEFFLNILSVTEKYKLSKQFKHKILERLNQH